MYTMLSIGGILFVKITLVTHCSSKNNSNTIVISANGLLQKQQYVHGLKHDVTIALCSIVPLILYEFSNFKGYQGTINMFEAIARSYWWPKLCQDVV